MSLTPDSSWLNFKSCTATRCLTGLGFGVGFGVGLGVGSAVGAKVATDVGTAVGASVGTGVFSSGLSEAFFTGARLMGSSSSAAKAGITKSDARKAAEKSLKGV